MLHRQADEVEDALCASAAPIYTQGGSLVRSIIEQADATRGRTTLVTRIKPCDEPWLMREMSKQIRFVKLVRLRKINTEFEEVPANVPSQLVDAVLTEASTKFSELAGIIGTPMMRRDGSLLLKQGYDAATGLLLINPPLMPLMPERPGEADAVAALWLLNELLQEMPFINEASRAVTLSALITPMVRAAMAFAPLHCADAPKAGSGKSYQFDISAAIATGKLCPVLAAGANKEETEKRLHGAALSGQPLISIDNVNGVLGGDFLSQLITQGQVEIRILGQNARNIQIQNRATVFANGNNIEIEGDLVRRTIRCSLDTEMENPERRQFKNDPVQMVLADRGKYIAAALTLVRAYLLAGQPQRLPPLAGFEDWTRTVRGALVWLGCVDPVTTQEGLGVEDPTVAGLDAMLEAWVGGLTNKTIPDQPLTVKQLASSNCGELDAQFNAVTFTREGDMLSTVKVGKFLQKHKGRIRKGVKLINEYNEHSKQQTWRLAGWQQFATALEAADKVVPLVHRQNSHPKPGY